MTTLNDPQDPQDQQPGIDEPELTQSPLAETDDVYVRGLLAIAGDAATDLPEAVAARWDAALAAESAARTSARAEAAPRSVVAHTPQGVDPVDSVAALVPLQARRRAPRGLRFAGIAASVAALALASGVVVNQLASTGGAGDSGDAIVAGASPVPEALPIADTVTTSGFSYSRAALDEEVRTLVREGDEYLDAPVAASGPEGDEPAAASGSAESETRDTAPSVEITDEPSVKSFLADENQRDNCTANLAQTVEVRPVAVDIGYFEGQPVAIVVLPARGDTSRVDVWVVDPDCDLEDAEVRLFRRMALP